MIYAAEVRAHRHAEPAPVARARAAVPQRTSAAAGHGHSLQRLVDGNAPVLQAFWPFTGYGYFWNKAPQNVPAPPAPPVHVPPAVVVVNPLLASFPATARARLLVLEQQMSAAVPAMPNAFRGDPGVLDQHIRPLYLQIRDVVAFPADLALQQFQQGLAAVETAATQYSTFCDDIRASVEQATRYYTTYHATLANNVKQPFEAATVSVLARNVAASNINTIAKKFVADAQAATATGTNALQLEQQNNVRTATARVATYFAMGRIGIGYARSFYQSPYDEKSASFGGEWALTAPDASLKYLKDDWVFHAHCEAVGEPPSYDGYTFKRSACHIKTEANRMQVGMSIPVNVEAEFVRVENDGGQQQRFRTWSQTSKGLEALKRKKRV